MKNFISTRIKLFVMGAISWPCMVVGYLCAAASLGFQGGYGSFFMRGGGK